MDLSLRKYNIWMLRCLPAMPLAVYCDCSVSLLDYATKNKIPVFFLFNQLMRYTSSIPWYNATVPHAILYHCKMPTITLAKNKSIPAIMKETSLKQFSTIQCSTDRAIAVPSFLGPSQLPMYFDGQKWYC
jgi:hypothetical protein